MRTLEANKAELVAAHRARDWGRAAELSQERERLKKGPGRCETCGVPVTTGSGRCYQHYVAKRYYGRRLAGRL